MLRISEADPLEVKWGEAYARTDRTLPVTTRARKCPRSYKGPTNAARAYCRKSWILPIHEMAEEPTSGYFFVM